MNVMIMHCWRTGGALILFAAAASLSACKDRPTQLKEQLGMAERANASPEEICRRRREIAQAYLEAGDEENYHTENLHAESRCYATQMQREIERGRR